MALNKNQSLNNTIELLQANFHLGDCAANARRIEAACADLERRGGGVLVTPASALSGGSTLLGDFLQRGAFTRSVQEARDSLVQSSRAWPRVCLILGCINQSAVAIQDGEVLEKETLLERGNQRFGFLSEDENDAAFIDKAQKLKDAGAQILLVLAGRAWAGEGSAKRWEKLQRTAKQIQLPVAAAQGVGGQDSFVFVGQSVVFSAEGELIGRAPFAEENVFTFLADQRLRPVQSLHISPEPPRLERMWRALVLGLRDYVDKNGFPGVILGMSGGLDSALVLALAVDALGANRVRAVMLPSPYTADISIEDTKTMVQRLGLAYEAIEIQDLMRTFDASLSGILEGGTAQGTTAENLQARIRGSLLMALSNALGSVVLVTSNKSEIAMGYCTLYGDMAGGFAPLRDVYKTEAYALARWRNSQPSHPNAPIVERIITRPPSAELRPDQADSDSLPPYEELDAILQAYLERSADRQELETEFGFSPSSIERVLYLLRLSEYKRRQSAPGLRISSTALGIDWKVAMGHGFQSHKAE